MKTEDNLTEKQEAFCQYYAQLTDTYNNGAWSYALAYGFDLENAPHDDFEKDDKGHEKRGTSSYDKMYNVCAVCASRMLRVAKVLHRIREIKASWVDDDKIIDSRMMDIIISGKDTDALAAIKHRNDLKNRVTKQLDITSGGEPVTALVRFMGEEDESQRSNS